jgi:hypothetical protein
MVWSLTKNNAHVLVSFQGNQKNWLHFNSTNNYSSRGCSLVYKNFFLSSPRSLLTSLL